MMRILQQVRKACHGKQKDFLHYKFLPIVIQKE